MTESNEKELINQILFELNTASCYDSARMEINRVKKILALCRTHFINQLPKRKEHVALLTKDFKEGRTPSDWQKKGYNECLDDIKRILMGEVEG
ncbi:MAG: hypothetical protein WC373_00810 [Smithella sp.]|jgi:hypothetical protein